MFIYLVLTKIGSHLTAVARTWDEVKFWTLEGRAERYDILSVRAEEVTASEPIERRASTTEEADHE
jgi:hypothetical protein